MPYAQQLGGVLWALGVGLLTLAVIYMTVRSGWFRKAGNDVIPTEDVRPEIAEPVHHYPEDLAEAHGRVPVIIKLIIGGYLIFLVWYVWNFITLMNGPLAGLDKFLTQ